DSHVICAGLVAGGGGGGRPRIRDARGAWDGRSPLSSPGGGHVRAELRRGGTRALGVSPDQRPAARGRKWPVVSAGARTGVAGGGGCRGCGAVRRASAAHGSRGMGGGTTGVVDGLECAGRSVVRDAGLSRHGAGRVRAGTVIEGAGGGAAGAAAAHRSLPGQ